MTEPEFLKNTITALSLLGNFGGLVFLTYNRMTGKDGERKIKGKVSVEETDKPVGSDHCSLVHKNLDARLDAMEENIGELFELQRAVAISVGRIEGTIEPFKNLATKFSQDVGRLEGILQRHR